MSKNNENKLVPKLRFLQFINNAEWHLTQLSKSLRIPVTYGIVKAGDFVSKGIKMVRGGDIKEGRVSVDLPLVSFEIHNQYKRTILCQGDIVISLVGYPGESAVIPNTLIGSNISRAVGLIRLNNDINPYYLVQYLNSPNGRKNVLKPSAGSAQNVVNLGEINKLLVPSTIPEEQQKIAACLSSLDEVITAENQKLELLKDHKKGLLQNLLPQAGETVPTFRFKEFEDSGEWQETTLTQVASFVNNKTQLENLTINSYISTENLLPDYAGVALASKLPSSGNFTKYQKGDILVSNIRPYLKKVWFADKDGACSNDVIVIRATSSISSEFLSNLLRNDAFIGYIMKNVEGVKMPRGDKDSIREYPIIFPKNPKEQVKIADTLSSIDDLIKAQIEKVEALQLHKKGLLQGLFPNLNEVTA